MPRRAPLLPQTEVSLGGTWCRTQPANTTLATCYNQNIINITLAAAIMAISGAAGCRQVTLTARDNLGWHGGRGATVIPHAVRHNGVTLRWRDWHFSKCDLGPGRAVSTPLPLLRRLVLLHAYLFAGIEGVTSGGGYVVRGVNVTFVCEDPVDEACSKKYG